MIAAARKPIVIGGRSEAALKRAGRLGDGYHSSSTSPESYAKRLPVIQAEGSADQQARWLPGLASGELTAGLGTRELAADAPGAAVAVVIEGEEAVLVASPQTEPFVSIDATCFLSSMRPPCRSMSSTKRRTLRAAAAVIAPA